MTTRDVSFEKGQHVKIADGSKDIGTVVETDSDENGEYYLVCRTYVEQNNKKLTHWYGVDELKVDTLPQRG